MNPSTPRKSTSASKRKRPSHPPIEVAGAAWIPHAALVLSFVLVAAAAFLPETRLWGVNHLAFYSAPVKILALAIMAAALVPAIGARVYRWIENNIDRLAGVLRRRPLLIAAIGLGAVAVFYLLHARTLLWGDGTYVANTMRVAHLKEIDVATYTMRVVKLERIYPLTDMINFIASTVGVKLGGGPISGVRVLNCIYGALFVTTLLAFARAAASPALRALAISLLLATGLIQVYFGYIENYAPMLWVSLLYVFAAYHAMYRRGSLWTPAVLLVVGTLLHIGTLLLLPSFLVFVARRTVARRNDRLLWAVTFGGLALTLIVGLGIAQSGTFEKFLLTITGTQETYGVFSPTHLLDIANAILAVLPLGVFLLGVWLQNRSDLAAQSGKRGSLASTPTTHLEHAVAWALAGPAVLFLLLFRPELGMARDWDLFTMTAAGLLVPGFIGLRRFIRTARAGASPAPDEAPSDVPRPKGAASDRAAPALGAAIVFAGVMTLAWIGIHASDARSVSRYEAILQYDRTHPGYAYESLAKHHERRGNFSEQIDALRAGYEETGNPRYVSKIGAMYYSRGELDEAEAHLREALDRYPSYSLGRVLLLGILEMRRRTDEIIAVAEEGLEYDANVAEFHLYLGKAYLRTGRVAEGVDRIERSLKLQPQAETAREARRILEQVRKQQEATPSQPNNP